MTDLKAMSLEDLARELDAVPYWKAAPPDVIAELRRRDDAIKRLVSVAQKIANIQFTGDVADELRLALLALEGKNA